MLEICGYHPGVFDTYYFEKNVFGDIVGVYAEDGTKVGTYKYDAWGNCTRVVNSSATALQKQIFNTYNPFRYRGYYYDVETALYYLQSRYYDPSTGRFINGDGYINANGDLPGYNMYAYCSNNPVMNVDPTGFYSWSDFWTSLGDLFHNIVDSIDFEISMGVGLGGSVEICDVEAVLLARYCFGVRKEVGENTTIGMIDEMRSGLSIPFADCFEGKIIIDDFVSGNKIEKDHIPEARANISIGLEGYIILGFSVKISFDIGHFLNCYSPFQ